MAVTPERMIADRYWLERPIGTGGMGVVWRARDRLLDREVAIKEITLPDTVPEHERDSLHARVLREARAAARLNHPGVITLYGVLNEQGRTFIVMELITAPTLAEIVAREGPLPPERVARIGLQVASALEAAHRAGTVHRDVKPANVMVGEDGKVWLGDFGIAQVQGDPKLTSSGIIVGSPAYMAPEQASGRDSGSETDLWGLGATMYYATEGRAPIERGNSLATLAAVVNEPPRPPRRAGALAPVLMSLLAKDPAARPALRQVRIRLARVAGTGREPAAAQPAVPVAPSGPSTPAPAEGAAQDTAEPWEAPTLARAPVPVVAAKAEEARDEPGPGPESGLAPFRFSEPTVRTGAAGRTGPDGRTGARRWLVTLAGLAGVVAVLAGVVAVVLVVALTGPLGGGGASGKREAAPAQVTGTPAARGPAPSAPQTTALRGGAPRTTPPPPQPQPGAGAASKVPSGWTSFSDPSGGYGVAYPSGWRRRTGLARHGTSFSEGTGRYIKVESAHPPQVAPDGDPVPGWIGNEQYWSARLPGYHLIGSVHRGSYHGMRAAIWEYTYVLNGRPTHGLDISFVSPSHSWGYSVLSLIPEDRWGSSQGLIHSFEQAFSPLG
jgi:eukaryotic-like serine/threonine-protein kinase